ncbi:MAG: type III-B CRISPR module-associated protein Cmr5 [Candidatus Sumerlaeia bacterium]|nr:type III-B CRISPR module-associated protein Cmr5 [Candidatus Sumerlaeia bacterium]
MTMLTRDQKRAQYALTVVEKLSEKFLQSKEKNQEAVGPKDFATSCKRASTRIMNAGLAGAYAFIRSKAKDENYETRAKKPRSYDEKKYHEVAKALEEYPEIRSKKIDSNFLNELTTLESQILRQRTEEAMALLNWLARIADGKAIEIFDEGKNSDE